MLFSAIAIVAGSQSAPEGQRAVRETQIRGYWIDPSSSPIWAGEDSGKDVRWNKVMKYRRDLRLEDL
jgi:hypothetical protein